MIRHSKSNQLTLNSGDKLKVATGAAIVPNSGTQPGAIAKPVATAATNSTPYGYTQAQADALVASVRTIIDVLKNAGLTA